MQKEINHFDAVLCYELAFLRNILFYWILKTALYLAQEFSRNKKIVNHKNL